MYCLYYLLACALLGPVTIEAIQSRVFDAKELRHEVHKYLVKLAIDRDSFHGICTGSIISTRRVVTSAHCVTMSDLKAVRVYHHEKNGLKKIGEADLKETSIHPDYIANDNTHHNRLVDIALLKTKEPIMHNEYVQPIDLGQFVPKFSDTGILAGYGENEEWGLDAREGAVVIARCPFNVKDLICSEDKVRAGSGDSGGALVYKKHLVGVTSGSCKDVQKSKPCVTVFSNIPKSLDWIRGQMAKYD